LSPGHLLPAEDNYKYGANSTYYTLIYAIIIAIYVNVVIIGCNECRSAAILLYFFSVLRAHIISSTG